MPQEKYAPADSLALQRLVNAQYARISLLDPAPTFSEATRMAERLAKEQLFGQTVAVEEVAVEATSSLAVEA